MKKSNCHENDPLEVYARRGFLRDLLFNNITSAKDIWNLQKKLNITTQPNAVMAVTVDNYYSETCNKSEIQKQNLRLKVLQSLEKCAEDFNALAVNMDENLYAVLFRVENDIVSQAEWAIELGRFIKDNVEEETGISVSIGIGRRYKDILDLHLSYKDAITACHHKFFLGKSQIIHIENVIPFSEELSLFSIEVESQLSVKVMSCDEEGAFSIVDELFSNAVQERSVNPLIMKTRLIEIITTLIKIAFEAGADQEKLAALSGRLVEEILRSDTISELRSQMREVLRGIIEEVSLGRKRMNLQVFEKAVSYIHENFRRPITLEEVAEHVYISSYYFSRHFKNFTGMNFIDYLTKVRIEEAKKLLLTTDLNISQISRQVGYHDPSYFGRVFKKVVGMPPSKFKVNKKVHIDRIFSEG